MSAERHLLVSRWPLVVAVVIYITACLATYLLAPSQQKTTTSETMALVLTGLVLLWYTWETHRLRLEAQRQTDMQMLPFVILETRRSALADQFMLSNIGKGPALNVAIMDVAIENSLGISVRFPRCVPSLVPGTSEFVEPESIVDGKSISSKEFFVSAMKPKYANKVIALSVEFDDIESRKYRVQERVHPGRLEIVGFVRK